MDDIDKILNKLRYKQDAPQIEVGVNNSDSAIDKILGLYNNSNISSSDSEKFLQNKSRLEKLKEEICAEAKNLEDKKLQEAMEIENRFLIQKREKEDSDNEIFAFAFKKLLEDFDNLPKSQKDYIFSTNKDLFLAYLIGKKTIDQSKVNKLDDFTLAEKYLKYSYHFPYGRD